MAFKHVPSNPDVAPHLKRIIIIITTTTTIIIIIIRISSSSFLVLDREWGNDPKDPIHILNLSSYRDPHLPPPLTYMLMIIRTWTYLVEGSKSATPSDYYVDRDHNMNLSSYGDPNLPPPLTYMLMIIRTWTYLVEGSKSATPSD